MEEAGKAIKGVVSAVAPGLTDVLDTYCISRYGKDSATLALTNPQQLLECIAGFYGSEETAQILLKIILKSLKR